MKRFSISLDDELGEWVESQAEVRGVSKSKVIRDAVEAAKSGDTTMVQSGEIVNRIDELENRVDALEGERNEAAAEGTGGIPVTETECSEDGDSDRDGDIIEAFRDWLSDRPPETEHGKEAMVETLRVLRNADGVLSTSEVQDTVYKSHNDHHSTAHSMWQSISRNIDEGTPGIEKAGYGRWRYSGDKETLQAIQSN